MILILSDKHGGTVQKLNSQKSIIHYPFNINLFSKNWFGKEHFYKQDNYFSTPLPFLLSGSSNKNDEISKFSRCYYNCYFSKM